MKWFARDLEGQVVVITGAAGGIGSALARSFARRGARLALLDLQAPRDLAAELTPGCEAIALACDVTDARVCEAVIAEVERCFGGVDALVNNAGITHRSPCAETSEGVLRSVMDVNFFGAASLTQAALPSLRARRGAVVAISSVAGFAPLLHDAGYVASKHALEGFMATLRAEEAPHGVDVLVVRPGYVETPLVHKALGARGGVSRLRQRPVGRRLSPEAASEAIVRAVQARKRELILTRIARASWWCSRLAPRLYEALMSASQGRSQQLAESSGGEGPAAPEARPRVERQPQPAH